MHVSKDNCHVRILDVSFMETAYVQGTPFPDTQTYPSTRLGAEVAQGLISAHVVCRWIENDLKSVDRSKTPWLLVGVHRMFYCDSSDYRSNDDADQTLAARMRDSLEDLFNEYKVCSHAELTCNIMLGTNKCEVASTLERTSCPFVHVDVCMQNISWRDQRAHALVSFSMGCNRVFA